MKEKKDGGIIHDDERGHGIKGSPGTSGCQMTPGVFDKPEGWDIKPSTCGPGATPINGTLLRDMAAFGTTPGGNSAERDRSREFGGSPGGGTSVAEKLKAADRAMTGAPRAGMLPPLRDDGEPAKGPVNNPKLNMLTAARKPGVKLLITAIRGADGFIDLGISPAGGSLQAKMQYVDATHDDNLRNRANPAIHIAGWLLLSDETMKRGITRDMVYAMTKDRAATAQYLVTVVKDHSQPAQAPSICIETDDLAARCRELLWANDELMYLKEAPMIQTIGVLLV